MKFNEVNCWERPQPTVVSGFSILVHTWNSACFGPWHLFIGVAGGTNITCGVYSVFFSSPFCTLCFPFCISVMGACLVGGGGGGGWGLMARFSAFASHR